MLFHHEGCSILLDPLQVDLQLGQLGETLGAPLAKTDRAVRSARSEAAGTCSARGPGPWRSPDAVDPRSTARRARTGRACSSRPGTQLRRRVHRVCAGPRYLGRLRDRRERSWSDRRLRRVTGPRNLSQSRKWPTNLPIGPRRCLASGVVGAGVGRKADRPAGVKSRLRRR